MLLGLIALIGAAGLLLLVTQLAAQRAERQIREEATQSAGLLAALLASEIEHYQALPITLATDSEVSRVLRAPDAAALDRLSRRLALISDQLGSAAIYLVDAQGLTIAASNAGMATSFIGNDYRFRDYFREAMRDGRGSQFAMGSTTARPGLYLSQRVDGPGGPLGVVVVKVEFGSLESDWRNAGTPAFVTDDSGIITITTDPLWRFKRPEAIWADTDDGKAQPRVGGRTVTMLRGRADTIVAGWTVHTLLPADARVRDAAIAAAALTGLAMAALASALLWFWTSRRRVIARQQEEERIRRILEERVAQRTAELSTANDQLREEMNERRRAEESARLLHEELEQANRLATLGQIAAGVTHEINQPVAAIRASADNACTLIDRGQLSQARTALGKIARMTERIGTITGELRAFSAKGGNRARLITVDSAIDGALMLMGTSLRQAGITLDRAPRNAAVKLWADKIRIEQILVNLLRNAVEALEGCAKPRIAIHVSASDTRVDIGIADNGPGIPEALVAVLFTPFRTTKPQGLGLGLLISRDIASSLGGELDLHPATTGDDDGRPGAHFLLTLPRAG